ncbi:hypothetical protein, partial [Thiolapillus sp.]
MFSLWRKARRENSAASRLLGSTSLRFALHGWQRRRSSSSIFSARRSWPPTPGANAQRQSRFGKDSGAAYWAR